jgi:YHS domain-containing protein
VLGLLVGLFRLLLVLLIVRILGRFVGAVIRGYRGQFTGTAPARPIGARELVRDPVCGTFVASDHAIAATIAGLTRYFCSTDCRDAALAGPARKALRG